MRGKLIQREPPKWKTSLRNPRPELWRCVHDFHTGFLEMDFVFICTEHIPDRSSRSLDNVQVFC